MRLSAEVSNEDLARLKGEDAKQKSIVEKDPAVVEAARQRTLAAALAKADRRAKGAAMGVGETADDIAKSGAAGVGAGVVSIPGGPVDLFRMGQLAKAYTSSRKWNPLADEKYKGRPYEAVLKQQDEERERGERGFVSPKTVEKWGGQSYIDAATPYLPGIAYEPKTRTGEVVKTGGEVLGGAVGGELPALLTSATRAATRAGVMAGGRELTRDVGATAKRSLIPGAAQAGAEQVSDNPLVPMSAALLAGGLSRTYGNRTAADAIRAGAGNATPAQLDMAEQIFQRAQREGLAISRNNIVDYVTRGGAQGLSELQRVVESGGNRTLREFFADNPVDRGPTRIRAAGERMLDRIGPESGQPSTLGERAAVPSQAMIDQAEAQVNASTRNRPEGYASFEHNTVPAPDFSARMGDPAFADAYRRVMNEPNYADLRANLAPDSVGAVDLVRRVMADEQRGLRTAGGSTQGMSETQATGLQGPINRAQGTASDASGPAAPLPPGQAPLPRGYPNPPRPRTPLEEVQLDQAQLREANVAPLDRGPVGDLSRATTTDAAGQAILPDAPREGAHVEIGRAVENLTQRDPNLALELVRNVVGTLFEKTTAPNVTGEPYTAGTKFWKTFAGSEGSEKRQVAQAAITGLPDGAARWQALSEMGQLFEAMGKRQAPGSKTAFNAEDIERLKGQGFEDAAIKLAGTGFTALPGMAKDAIERFRLGRNSDEIARLATDPAAGQEFRRIIAETRTGSADRWIRYARLLGSFVGTAEQAVRPVVEEPQNQPLMLRIRPPEAR